MPTPPHERTFARIVLLALMVGWTGTAQAQQASDGLAYAYHTLKMDDGTTIRYALVLPDDFDASKTYPAFLALPSGPQKRGQRGLGPGKLRRRGCRPARVDRRQPHRAQRSVIF